MSQLILGTPLTKTAMKIMMLGCGELGKEVVIELQRMGVEVIGVHGVASDGVARVSGGGHKLGKARCTEDDAIMLVQRTASPGQRDWTYGTL